MAEHARKVYEKRLGAMRLESQSWRPHWKEINEWLIPRRGRFLSNDKLELPNKGDKRNQKIINSSATIALRTATSGIMSGLTSPARPWLDVITEDLALREFGPVKVWLEEVRRTMLSVFAISNLYKVLPQVYENLIAYGTAAMIVFDDIETVIRCEAFPIGSFYLANGSNGEVNSCYREFHWTVDQAVKQFGAENLSQGVRSLYDRSETEKWIPFVHLIEPNDERVPGALGPRGMAYRSVWFERDSQLPELTVSRGYEQFPIMAPRWFLETGDINGRSPGMDSLGDIKELQHHEKRKAQAIDKIISPTVNAPSALKTQATHLQPNAVIYTDSEVGVRPIYEVPPQILQIREDIAEVKARIARSFHEDLFLMLASDPRVQPITAREVEERHEEKLLQLGPVLERIQTELLKPLIDRTFALMLRSGLIPPAPRELQGAPLRVEFISILAQAQRSVGTRSIIQLIDVTSAITAMGQTDVLDKVDWDQALDEYGIAVGVPAKVIRPDREVAALRAERQRQQRIQERTAMAGQLAEAAKDASEADTGTKNLLTDLRDAAQSGQIDPNQLAGAP